MTRRLNRSALFLPASNSRAIAKSRTIDADSILFDLEDSVAPQAKADARSLLCEQFKNRDFGRSFTGIRCNGVASEAFLYDLEAVIACQPDAVILPKVSSVDDVRQFEAAAEKAGLAESIQSWFMIETAAGVANLADVARVGKQSRWKLDCLIVGHNDLANETGVSLREDRKYLQPWLMQIILQAKVADLQVLDSVWNNFKDLQGMEQEANQGVWMGFDGKTLIHPSQVEIANRAYSPGIEQVTRAHSIVAAFEKTENRNKGVISLDGEMVERLHFEQSRRLLQQLAATKPDN